MPLGASFNVMIFRNSVMGDEEFTIPANQVHIQPNPIAFGNAAEVVLGDVINGSVEISIYDLTGKQVYAVMVQADPATKTYLLPTRDLARGMYVLKVANNGKANAQKLIIQ